MRKNGWEPPFHYLQVITWVFFPTIMGSFFAFYTPLLEVSAAYMGTLAYGATCAIVIFAVIRCTGCDPSDDSITRQAAHGQPPLTEVGDDQVYCNVCVQYVHKESRHCRLCDKCVAVFDHHCKWLNNCVGKKNYKHFLTSVIGATVLLATQVGFGAFLLWLAYSSPDVMKKRSASAFGCSGEKDDSGLCVDDDYRVPILAIRAIHAVLLALLVPWCFLIAQLAFFHFQLCIENITTYDYIVRKRKRKLQRERENAVRAPWWKLLYARLCCQPQDPVDDHKTGEKSQSASRFSVHSETEEQAAIEAEVDEDLEVLSARSGDAGDRRGGSLQIAKNGQPPSRGFGLHVNFGSLGGAAGASTVRTPNGGGDDISYMAAPNTPRSPRSDPSSAYLSDTSDADQLSSSMVMYGRPTDPPANHVV